MTREEAIEYLKCADTTVGKKMKTRTAEAIEMAIKALEQTDGDLISRKEAEKCCLDGWNKDYKDILEDIRKLPSAGNTAELQPIVLGKWNDWYFENGYTDAFHCQVCQHLFTVTQGRENMNFCPNCGAKMEESEEE